MNFKGAGGFLFIAHNCVDDVVWSGESRRAWTVWLLKKGHEQIPYLLPWLQLLSPRLSPHLHSAPPAPSPRLSSGCRQGLGVSELILSYPALETVAQAWNLGVCVSPSFHSHGQVVGLWSALSISSAFSTSLNPSTTCHVAQAAPVLAWVIAAASCFLHSSLAEINPSSPSISCSFANAISIVIACAIKICVVILRIAFRRTSRLLQI